MRPEFTTKDIERFWSHVDRSGGPDACWPWTGGLRDGYGRFTVWRDGKQRHLKANRVSWMLHAGDIPEEMRVCHDCPGGDNRACVNPRHLFLGTASDNRIDALNKGMVGKLTVERVRKARALAAAGWLQRDIAARLGVTQSNVSYAVRGKTWRQVK